MAGEGKARAELLPGGHRHGQQGLRGEEGHGQGRRQDARGENCYDFEFQVIFGEHDVLNLDIQVELRFH